MSSCTFTVPFSGDADTILNKAKTAVENQGGTFTGDNTKGSFHVSLLSNNVAGSYVVEGQELTLTITDKPFFVPCNTIESFLKSKLA
jgi:hypothetical protein